jgi:hypothetical protein
LPARAQQFDKECDPEDLESCSQPLLEGEPAPFSGQLLTPKLAIKLGQKAASFDVRLKLELDRNRELFELDLELEKKLHQIDQDACKKQVDLLTERLEKAQLEKWYQHPLFVATISVVITSALFVGSAYIYKSVSQ